MQNQGMHLLLIIVGDMFLPSNWRTLLQQAAWRTASRPQRMWSDYRKVTVTLQLPHSYVGDDFDTRGLAVGMCMRVDAIGYLDSTANAEWGTKADWVYLVVMRITPKQGHSARSTL